MSEIAKSTMNEQSAAEAPLTLVDLAAIVKHGFNDVNTRIETKFSEFEKKILSNLKKLEKDAGFLSQRIDAVEERCEKLERLSLLTDLIMHGVPYNDNENLQNIFNKICESFGYNPPSYGLQSIFRTVQKKNSAIVIKFLTDALRNDFFSAYLKTKTLSLMDIGFSSNVRVFIKESLTKGNAAIFRECIAMKKCGKLFNTYTRRGCVVIKIKEDSKPTIVLSSFQLRSLISNLETSQVPDDFNINASNHKRRPSGSPKMSSTPKINKHRKLAIRECISGKMSSESSSELSDTIVDVDRLSSVGPLDRFFTKLND